MQSALHAFTPEWKNLMCILGKHAVFAVTPHFKAATAVHTQRTGGTMVRPIDGQGFAFVPRTVVAQPKAFGLAPGPLEPAHDVDTTSERYRAAMLQHVMAVAVRSELLKAEGVSPATFVSRFRDRGLSADRVRRILRGETMAQLTDVMFWMSQLPGVAVAISEQTAEWFDTTANSALSNGPERTSAAAAEIAGTESAPDESESLVGAPRAGDLKQEPGARTLGQEMAALRRETGVPVVRRSPQNPYEPSPRRMR